MRSTRTVTEDGIQIWRDKDGEYHREDGPAIIFPPGRRNKCLNGCIYQANELYFWHGYTYHYDPETDELQYGCESLPISTWKKDIKAICEWHLGDAESEKFYVKEILRLIKKVTAKPRKKKKAAKRTTITKRRNK